MCLSNEAAAIKLAERDNLVGELIKALEYYAEAVRPENSCGGGYYDFVDDGQVARAALAKAREGAQS